MDPSVGCADEGLCANVVWEMGVAGARKYCFDHVEFEMAFEHLGGALKSEV